MKDPQFEPCGRCPVMIVQFLFPSHPAKLVCPVVHFHSGSSSSIDLGDEPKFAVLKVGPPYQLFKLDVLRGL